MSALFPKAPKIHVRKHWKSMFSITLLSDCLTPLQGIPANIRINLILPENRISGLHLRCWYYGSIFIQLLVMGSENACTLKQSVMADQGPPKVVDFGTNRMRVCNFLLVINSNLGHILPRFRDIASFCWKQRPHPYSTRILGCSPWMRSLMLGIRGEKTLS